MRGFPPPLESVRRAPGAEFYIERMGFARVMWTRIKSVFTPLYPPETEGRQRKNFYLLSICGCSILKPHFCSLNKKRYI